MLCGISIIQEEQDIKRRLSRAIERIKKQEIEITNLKKQIKELENDPDEHDDILRQC